MTYRTCWILLYNLISPDLRTDNLDDIFRQLTEKLAISFSQLHKRIINSKITLASKFVDFWCSIVIAALFALIFSVFKDSILHKNIPFVKKLENDIVHMYSGAESNFLKSLHQNILTLIPETFQPLLPTSLTNNNLSSIKSSYSRNLSRPSSVRKPQNLIQRPISLKVPPVHSKLIPIHMPQYAKKERIGRGDNSGVPISKAEELGKKNEQTMNDYKVTRAKMIHKLCEQEELYYELDDVAPEIELGITFEDFPNPHLPVERTYARSPRLQNYVRKDKNVKRHKYRVIPEPEETMAIIANAHEYLTANPVFV